MQPLQDHQHGVQLCARGHEHLERGFWTRGLVVFVVGRLLLWLLLLSVGVVVVVGLRRGRLFLPPAPPPLAPPPPPTLPLLVLLLLLAVHRLIFRLLLVILFIIVPPLVAVSHVAPQIPRPTLGRLLGAVRRDAADAFGGGRLPCGARGVDEHVRGRDRVRGRRGVLLLL